MLIIRYRGDLGGLSTVNIHTRDPSGWQCAAVPSEFILPEKAAIPYAMALKSYHRETLNDNWFEERAEPLNGVLPHDGVKEYSTTAKVDFAGAKPLQPRVKARMVNDRSLGPALLQSAGADISQGFRSALPPPNEEQERRYLETIHRASFGSPQQDSAVQLHSMSGPAGGPGGRRVERGKAASGAMGEVYKTSAEPQRDTASQRSWLYSSDPLVSTMERRRDSSPGGTSQPLSEPRQTPPTGEANYRRKSTSITRVPLNHRGVFMDD